MSKSNKARFGTSCKKWKDSVFASRSQARARAKRKQRRNQKDRTIAKRQLKQESE